LVKTGNFSRQLRLAAEAVARDSRVLYLLVAAAGSPGAEKQGPGSLGETGSPGSKRRDGREGE